jgi:hypothetical protein
MIKIYVNLFGKKLCNLGIYGINGENISVKEDFWKLPEVITEIGNAMKILIAGDFNSGRGKRLMTRWWVHL